MINIAKKKLPIPVVALFVYLSYCAAAWYITRGEVAYIAYRYKLGGWLANDIVAFFLGGLIPVLVYELLYFAIGKTKLTRIGAGQPYDTESVRYVINYAVITANLILFALKFMYLAVPMYAHLLDIILDPAVTLTVVGLFMLYVFKMQYVPKHLFSVAFSTVFGAFVTVYGLLTVISVITTVV